MIVGFSLALQSPWLGLILLAAIALAWQRWWTCLFGLMNALALLGGMLGCLLASL